MWPLLRPLDSEELVTPRITFHVLPMVNVEEVAWPMMIVTLQCWSSLGDQFSKISDRWLKPVFQLPPRTPPSRRHVIGNSPGAISQMGQSLQIVARRKPLYVCNAPVVSTGRRNTSGSRQ
jgi:hypothetical protein